MGVVALPEPFGPAMAASPVRVWSCRALLALLVAAPGALVGLAGGGRWASKCHRADRRDTGP